ncbi:hypothetical protein Y032_0002g870 [Ancylostoma ceylanicum]|uniref:Uncharacterized protein n=1 Tax=Ancylostoma ceylanicum TaxID=53326 RepID=A0A016W183_9BILA|nr:hypothetical protein Y032_0002g870 [Ancylostoma ceylanicum]
MISVTGSAVVSRGSGRFFDLVYVLYQSGRPPNAGLPDFYGCSLRSHTLQYMQTKPCTYQPCSVNAFLKIVQIR